jgi:hypothetical protein
VRIETGGQWSKGACVVDRRERSRVVDAGANGEVLKVVVQPPVEDGLEAEEVAAATAPVVEGADEGDWLGEGGNRVWVCEKSGWTETFGEVMIRRILGLEVEK